MALNLDGLIPATVLPMDADGGIDEPALRSYIGWVVAQGPVALAINVDTGEGPHLTHDEKVRILKIVRDVTDLPIVAGLAGPSTDAAVRQARDFRAAGADALFVLPDPGLPEPAARPCRAGGVPPGRGGRGLAAHPVPAAAGPGGRQFRQRHAGCDGRGRRGRGRSRRPRSTRDGSSTRPGCWSSCPARSRC